MAHTLLAIRRGDTGAGLARGEGHGTHTAESALLVGLISVAAAVPLMAFGRSLRAVLSQSTRERVTPAAPPAVHCLCHHSDTQTRRLVGADPYVP